MFKDSPEGQTQYEQDMSNRVCNTVMIPVEEYEALRKQVEEKVLLNNQLADALGECEEQLALTIAYMAGHAKGADRR
jgi:hypothetical protein